MWDQQVREWALTHAAQSDPDKLYVSRRALYDLINVMSGFASNGTACGMCELGNKSANEVLERFCHATGISREIAYRGAKGLAID